MTKIVLASRSASRRAMLDAAGVAYRCEPSDVDEAAIKASMTGQGPDTIAQALADAKALAVSAPGSLVLGSDSLVEVSGRLFDKPESREQAAEHLRFFSGQTMRLHSAATLQRDGEIVWQHAGMAQLSVRPLSDAFIASYLDAEWPEVSYCVGVFRIEALGVQLFEAIAGDQFTVLGMPLLPVLGALREFGVLPS